MIRVLSNKFSIFEEESCFSIVRYGSTTICRIEIEIKKWNESDLILSFTDSQCMKNNAGR